MESKIQKVLQECFPEAFKEQNTGIDFSEYTSLQQVAHYTMQLLQQNEKDKLREIFKMIDHLYHYGTLHERNSIVNEFLCVLADKEKSGALKEHLKLMPENLKGIYIKSILEN